jgi:ATP-dependent RNA helicase DDX23/PRP28
MSGNDGVDLAAVAAAAAGDDDNHTNLEGLEIDKTLLDSLSPSERKEAIAAARAAQRAEERAEERQALKHKLHERELLKQRQKEAFKKSGLAEELGIGISSASALLKKSSNSKNQHQQQEDGGGTGDRNTNNGGAAAAAPPRVKFISKRQREAAKQQQLQQSAAQGSTRSSSNVNTALNAGSNGNDGGRSNNHKKTRHDNVNVNTAATSRTSTTSRENSNSYSAENPQQHRMSEADRAEIKKSYLGREATLTVAEAEEERRAKIEEKRKKRKQKKQIFKFQWDDSEDTLGGGVGGGATGSGANNGGRKGGRSNNNRASSATVTAPVDALYVDLNQIVSNSKSTNYSRTSIGNGFNQSTDRIGRRDHGSIRSVESVATKLLEKMTPRDWRIVRENYDIRIKGGKAPPPLRSFRETTPPLHPAILHSIEHTLKFTEPSPIQRQAIPIGLQRRDLIGIAETGSGKTLAFGIPLCHFILNMPLATLKSVADEGPLALVMAPTRELALQIDVEFQKLLGDQEQVAGIRREGESETERVEVKTLPVVGGQNIQSQAYQLRNGVHVVVGTPGRINECIEMAYLVLNQCSYIVLDEADRMIDLGFAPQIENVLDNMGGSLKSENEREAYAQEAEDLQLLATGVPKHRLTAMFSATMPSEVERMAKAYLRHPAVVSIGDSDSSKNTRITQNIIYLNNPSLKEKTLRDLLNKSRSDEKIIVFVNEKKHAEGVARMVEHSHKKCVVLHGGKSQEQREENLDKFRRGGVVLVATDVAGRGLDIPDVTHIINFNLPARSIDNYCHRIGRTGRAGKQGLATSLMTDEDEGMMAPLLAYLKSTNAHIPDKLARHPSAVGLQAGPMY